MIRNVRRSDLPECVRVIRESFRTVAEAFGLTEENAPRFTAFATTQERLAWHMDGERRPMFLYEEDGVICGYCSLLPKGDGTCELGNLAVLPDYRRRGIGGRLLDHAIATAKSLGQNTITLGIVEENTPLKTWYERRGAIHTGTKKFDFFPFTCGYMEIPLN